MTTRAKPRNTFGDVNNGAFIKFDTSGLLDALDALGAKAGEYVRGAAQAGAQVLYEEAKLRAPVSEHAHYFYGRNSHKSGVRYLFRPGNLKSSIYQTYSADNSKENVRATYHISWNHQDAPYGFMVEFGTSSAAAHPFMRPAYEAAKGLSMEIARDHFAVRMQSAIAEMSAA